MEQHTFWHDGKKARFALDFCLNLKVSMLRLRIAIFCFLFCPTSSIASNHGHHIKHQGNWAKCPCENEKPILFNKITLCLHPREIFNKFQYNPLAVRINTKLTLTTDFKVVDSLSAAGLFGCSVVVHADVASNISSYPYDRTLRCPGVCLPIPVLNIKISKNQSWVDQFAKYPDSKAVTCSVDAKTVRNLVNVIAKGPSLKPEAILAVMAFYRINECNEHPVFKDTQFTAVRRNLKLLILYIGSQNRMSLLEQQLSVVKKEPFDGPDATLVWLATDVGFVPHPGLPLSHSPL